MEKTLGIDVGATKIEWALSRGGKIEKGAKINTPHSKKLLLILKKIIKVSGAREVGVCLPGFVQKEKASLLPNICGVKNIDVKAELGKAGGAKIFVENDAKCAALALWRKRGMKKDDDFALVMPGSGIGGAIVRGGRLVRGSGNCAGEFGHMKFLYFGGGANKISAGVAGSKNFFEWEQICGGKGIEKKFDSVVRRNGANKSKILRKKSAKEIFESKSALEKKVAGEAAEFFGVGMANIANALNPKEIIVAGSLSNAYMGKHKKQVMRTFSQNAIEPAKKVRITKCSLKNPSLAGALLLCKKERKINSFLGL
ncbi:hypothetical protein COU37_00190 [Candidatus Micrarchaeota archaeon CG10_big_fil_rev_8_21_14_0_10_45_29]|nr:MAG: hypothetical protein COU37_00190 [Candidatus Micrarchaeota archaeon CG10_big_fil_rev_8_21_14_0_10_45_29]